MQTLVRRLAVAVVAAAALSGCHDNSAQAPKEYAPPPQVGAKGALRGGDAPSPTPPTAPQQARR